MALTKISTGGVKDDAASQAIIADEAVDEARLQISNAGSNGQFLSKQSGNTGGLTWATPPDNNTVYTHPNHSGEVTSTADGAQVIVDDIVDEANLKISNAGTNGQYLQKQSGNTGGLTWADAGGGFSTLVSLTSGSSASWSIPSGVSVIKVICTGGGAGGCGSFSNEAAGAGGGGGGTSIHYFDVSGGGTATYTIGAGGGGAGNQGGGDGGNSTFAYGGTTITGGGGEGAENNDAVGGAGGVGSGGSVNLTGGGGQGGMRAEDNQRVNNAVGGTSYWGGGVGYGKGRGGNQAGISSAANSGAGGSGSCGTSTGGSGGSGLIVIEY